ncbi:hypothetical protein BAUCODRAFT_147640 [Baudoinia panamericana UAMH 10762]|uniref:Uncharacterized protein n=1 Tax=Baudoinia panamericana (strain UAMH 10762) TaxID=717646 RepID=M2N0X7_BAUPA|nr:uncharacterized protein BAUCODRAFT_147640 [Baudoinia panamericana UAMH 10762]EMC97578.1 hypothetical protein BAUCODRAFT_147640 [Baudoinia panamericana UAMH 10762]
MPSKASRKRAFEDILPNATLASGLVDSAKLPPAKKVKKGKKAIQWTAVPLSTPQNSGQTSTQTTGEGLPGQLLAQHDAVGTCSPRASASVRTIATERRMAHKRQPDLPRELRELRNELRELKTQLDRNRLDSLLKFECKDKETAQLKEKLAKHVYHLLKAYEYVLGYAEDAHECEEKDTQVRHARFLVDKETSIKKTLVNELAKEKEATRLAKADVQFYRDETEHSTTLVRMLEEDLSELRRLENTERQIREQRLDRKNSLPPVYGSLDDDDRIPLGVKVQEAKDSGALEVAAFKRTIRYAFNQKLQRALREWRHAVRKGSHLQSISDRALVVKLSKALGQASRNIDALMDRCNDFNDETSLSSNGSERASANKSSLVHLRRRARQEYVHDRSARLIFDLISRVLAALNLYPMECILTPDDAAETLLNWSAADAALLKALRVVVTTTKSTGDGTDRLLLIQYYTTHVNMLGQQYRQCWIKCGVPPPDHDPASTMLGSTTTWLVELFETERMMAAGATDAHDSLNELGMVTGNSSQAARTEVDHTAGAALRIDSLGPRPRTPDGHVTTSMRRRNSLTPSATTTTQPLSITQALARQTELAETYGQVVNGLTAFTQAAQAARPANTIHAPARPMEPPSFERLVNDFEALVQTAQRSSLQARRIGEAPPPYRSNVLTENAEGENGDSESVDDSDVAEDSEDGMSSELSIGDVSDPNDSDYVP